MTTVTHRKSIANPPCDTKTVRDQIVDHLCNEMLCTCGCGLKRNRVDVHNVRKAALESTIVFANAIDARINTMLSHFIPYGHSGKCLLQANGDPSSPCCWQFSQFYTHIVGVGTIVAWLETYVSFDEPFHVILEDFAFLAAILNDHTLTVRLAHGILLYFDGALREIDSPPRGNGSETKSARNARVLHSTGWASQVYSTTTFDDEVIQKCVAILERRQADFRRVLLAEEVLALKETDIKKQQQSRKPFASMSHALLTPFCVDKANWIGIFFIRFFTDLLPLNALTHFNETLKRLSRRMYSAQTSARLANMFASHRRVANIADAKQRESLRETLATVPKQSLRSNIDRERGYISTLVDEIRYSLLKFLNNFVLYSRKLTVLLHMAPASLLILNVFRLHARGSLPLLMSFSYYRLANGSNVGGKRPDDDPAIICAPYCFNCGVYMDGVWPPEMQHKQLECTFSAAQSTQTFLCTCNMARYCSRRCASLHYSLHRPLCCGTPANSATAINAQASDEERN